MGFHFEEEGIVGGSIDNRVKGKTVLKINFTNQTTSVATLQGNPSRDLAGSLWTFRNPFAVIEEDRSDECFFIPTLTEGMVGEITYTRRREVPVLPPKEHYDMLFDDDQGEPPTKIAPVLELEWFTPKFGQVEIDCQRMRVELVEMSWVMTAQEAVETALMVDERREEMMRKSDESWESFAEEMELIEEYVANDPEPHELEECCFLIVQEFAVNSADGSEAKEELHGDLVKLQEQIAGAFGYLNHDGGFDDVSATVKLLSGVLPFIDRAAEHASFVAPVTHELLARLRDGVVALRDKLAGD